MSGVNLEGKHKELQAMRATVITRLKHLSGKSKADEALPTLGKRRRSPAPFSLTTEKPPQLEDPDSVKKRNKNVFNSMLGHLQRAKDRLIQDQPKLETQTKATQKVVEDLKKQEDYRREQVREELNVRASNFHLDTEETTGRVRQKGPAG